MNDFLLGYRILPDALLKKNGGKYILQKHNNTLRNIEVTVHCNKNFNIRNGLHFYATSKSSWWNSPFDPFGIKFARSRAVL